MGVDEELYCSIILFRTAPYADEEVHWNKRNFPVDVEHEEVK